LTVGGYVCPSYFDLPIKKSGSVLNMHELVRGDKDFKKERKRKSLSAHVK